MFFPFNQGGFLLSVPWHQLCQVAPWTGVCHNLQPASPLAGHECKESFLVLMAVKSQHRWNTLCRSILNCWGNAFKNVFFVASFPCRGFQPFWLERRRHYFKTFRVLEINKWGRFFALFSSSTKGQKPLHLDADTERAEMGFIPCKLQHRASPDEKRG